EEDEQLDAMVDALRPLMLDGTISNIPSCFVGTGIMTFLGKRKDFWDGAGPIPEEVLAGVREQTGAGHWMCRFALYGRETQVNESLAAVKAAM
ncbi:FAD-binding oxidoreductase, partial [Streptomyces prasinus]